VRREIAGILILIMVLVGCGTDDDEPPRPEPSLTPVPAASATPAPQATTTPLPALTTSTGPYRDAGALLDGVCFEFLLTLNGQSWVWSSPADLAAFYDQADASKLCLGPVTRGDVDFSQEVLAGMVNVTSGCDAAHHVVELVRDDSARSQTLLVQLDIRSGCDYELVQPLLVAVPAPPPGYTVQIVMSL